MTVEDKNGKYILQGESHRRKTTKKYKNTEKVVTLFILPKTSSSLLIHFCSRSYTINSHKEHFLWFNDAKQHLHVNSSININKPVQIRYQYTQN